MLLTRLDKGANHPRRVGLIDITLKPGRQK
jgi:hypothetical protein